MTGRLSVCLEETNRMLDVGGGKQPCYGMDDRDCHVRVLANQRATMQAQVAILDRLDDRKTQILAALDAEYGSLFTAEDKSGIDEATVEEIVLMYMARWGVVAVEDHEANTEREKAVDESRPRHKQSECTWVGLRCPECGRVNMPTSPHEPVNIGSDGRCMCNGATKCPLDRTGWCTESELQAAGVPTIRDERSDK